MFLHHLNSIRDYLNPTTVSVCVGTLVLTTEIVSKITKRYLPPSHYMSLVENKISNAIYNVGYRLGNAYDWIVKVIRSFNIPKFVSIVANSIYDLLKPIISLFSTPCTFLIGLWNSLYENHYSPVVSLVFVSTVSFTVLTGLLICLKHFGVIEIVEQ